MRETSPLAIIYDRGEMTSEKNGVGGRSLHLVGDLKSRRYF